MYLVTIGQNSFIENAFKILWSCSQYRGVQNRRFHCGPVFWYLVPVTHLLLPVAVLL